VSNELFFALQCRLETENADFIRLTPDSPQQVLSAHAGVR
jgi:hypothetical protein